MSKTAIIRARVEPELKEQAETIPEGGTADEIVTVPAGSASGTKIAIYDRNLNLVNGSAAGIGGRLRFIQVP